MSLIRLPIDTKSLYLNVKNDNQSGHTATVATPLKQGNSIHQELSRILQVPENINPVSREMLISSIQSKSRAEAVIRNVYVFDKVSVNGKRLSVDCSFCIYIREEIGYSNVHYGRQKVHYPMSLRFEDESVKIDNTTVLKAISKELNDYAFVVEAFEYFEETGVLNFDVTVVGSHNIPYSKLFVNKKGVGNKYTDRFTENSDVYDREIISLREKLGYSSVNPENFNEIMEKNYLIAIDSVCKHLKSIGAEHINFIRSVYPYSIYDIEYLSSGIKHYLIIKHTSNKKKYFNLPTEKTRFLNDFSKVASLALVSDINGTPEITIYSIEDFDNLEKSINSIIYTDRNK